MIGTLTSIEIDLLVKQEKKANPNASTDCLKGFRYYLENLEQHIPPKGHSPDWLTGFYNAFIEINSTGKTPLEIFNGMVKGNN